MDDKPTPTTIVLSTFTRNEKNEVHFLKQAFDYEEEGYDEKMGHFLLRCIKNKGFILPYCFNLKGVSFYPSARAKEIITQFRKEVFQEEFESIGEGEDYTFVEYEKGSPEITEELKKSIKEAEEEIVLAVRKAFDKFKECLAGLIYSIEME